MILYQLKNRLLRMDYLNIKRRLNDKKLQCSWSKELSVFIHRFDLGSYTCRCGTTTVEKPEESRGWRNASKSANKSSNN